MSAIFRHFAINADDVQRAKAFYESVLRWTFTPWGPPNFYQVRNPALGSWALCRSGVALWLMAGGLKPFESSFEVEDIRATLAAVKSHGGKVLMPPYLIEGVGEVGMHSQADRPKATSGARRAVSAGRWKSASATWL